MSKYLMIENVGEAPIEGYTVLGFSSTRNCGVSGTIGKFGSGNKHAINLCLREGLKVWAYCGTTRIQFGLESATIGDGLTTSGVQHVTFQRGNNKPKRTGWVLDFGGADWTSIGMALREFVANAIDRTIREGRTFDAVSVELVDDSERRAKSGSTRIYVEANKEVRAYLDNINKHFLQLSDSPKPTGILTKTEGPEGKGCVIYREGVYVRTLDDDSLYDYNFSADEVSLDECRNSTEWNVRAAVAKRVGNSDANTLTAVIRADLDGKEVLETSIDPNYMFGVYTAPNDQQCERWQEAWGIVGGEKGVVCNHSFNEKSVIAAGYVPHNASNLGEVLKAVGVPTSADILGSQSELGRVPAAATAEATEAVDWAWEVFEIADLIDGRMKPSVHGFQDLSTEGDVKGYTDNLGVHIRSDVGRSLNSTLRKTALGEVASWLAIHHNTDSKSMLLDALMGVAA